jgi:hypothetical protein
VLKGDGEGLQQERGRLDDGGGRGFLWEMKTGEKKCRGRSSDEKLGKGKWKMEVEEG